jgi:ribosomal protein S18 acetylase RimI-like enzyme
VQVRLAASADALAIATVHVRSWQAAYEAVLPAEYLNSLSVGSREAMWLEAISRGSLEILILESAGELLGFIAFGPCRDAAAPTDQAEIWALYVSPSHWSKGLGRCLWMRARERLEQRQYKTVAVWVLSDNARATRFYEAAGFRLEPLSSKVIQVGGTEVSEVRYVAAWGS